jgi:DNA (cytosine-5)-methyltransferase 1
MHEPQLIDAIRDRLIATGKPYVIENVMGAKPYMRDPIQLCGTMFDLPIARHRLIETSFGAMAPYHPKCNGVAKKFAAERGWEYRDMSVTGKGRHAGTSARWGEIMGIDWHISQHEFREAIPPAYSDCIGRQMVRHIPMIDLDCENCAEKIS